MRETIDVDGIQLGPSTDFLSLVREQLKDGSIWPSDSGPDEGLWHAIDSAKGTRIHDQLLDAVVGLLSDADTEVRTRAIVAAQNYGPDIDSSTLLSALRTHPQLYVGVKPQGVSESYMPDLAWGILQAVNAEPNGNPEVIAALRKAAGDPTNGFRVMGGLAAGDPAWVIDRATTLVSQQPIHARIILANLKGTRRREQFVRALASEPASFRRELAKVIPETIQSSDERERLTALLT